MAVFNILLDGIKWFATALGGVIIIMTLVGMVTGTINNYQARRDARREKRHEQEPKDGTDLSLN